MSANIARGRRLRAAILVLRIVALLNRENSMKKTWCIAATLALSAGLAAAAIQDKKKEGYSDTPVITGQKWKVHDNERPVPPVVTPGAQAGATGRGERQSRDRPVEARCR